jgi:flagellar hook-length control protein FliK
VTAAARAAATPATAAVAQPDEPVQADASRPNTLPTVSAATAAQSTTPVAAALATARPAAALQHPPLATQLARPLLTLAHAGDGSHSITITVAPDRLGPVTVQAVVMGDQLRVELFAPTDLARDAVRGVLGELRRDLAATGIHATLGLSADDAPARQGQQGQQHQHAQNPGSALGQPGGQAGREARPGEHPSDAQPATQPDSDPALPAEPAAPTQLGAASAHPHIDLIA